jgi:hypothetical protein
VSGCEDLASKDFYKWRVCIENACGECLQDFGANVYRDVIPGENPIGSDQNREPGIDVPSNIPVPPPNEIPYNVRDRPIPEHKKRRISWFDRIKRTSYLDKDRIQRSYGSHKVHRNKDHLYRDRDHKFRPNQQNQPVVPGDRDNVIRNAGST